jgi:TonB-linked SusC/RagA family outer membrane protein
MRKQKKVILHFAALSLAILLGSAKAEAQNYYAANSKKAVKAGSIAALVSPSTSAFETITGKITDKSGNGVAGVSVTVKGKSKGTSSGADGSFSIDANKGDVLIFSSVGFETQQVTVGNDNSISVQLADKSGQLNEVVVTALGISRQAKTLVYATQTVKASELTEARDANNVLNSLQGKIANVVVTQGSGGPGSGARIVLRGNRSIQGSNNALIVVDGVPFNNNTYRSSTSDFGDVQGSDGASSINPDDIESMNVLRGASAAALYGSEAGNGVIVITTKKGKKDRIAVTLNSGIATESVFALPQFQNSYGQGNGGALSVTSGESWGAKLDGRSYTNYLGNQSNYSAQNNNVKDFFRNGLSINNSIGISGGTEKMQTYLSYTNNNIQGIVPKNDLIRHTVNLRITNQISKRFSTDAKVTYISQDIKNRPRNGENNAPAIDIYNVARSFSTADLQQYEFTNNVGINTPTAFPSTLSSIYQNPYWMANRYSENETRDRLVGFITAKFNITDWLSLSGRANLDKTIDKGDTKIYQGTVLWAKPGGKYEVRDATGTNKWFDVMLEGNNKITSDIKVTYRVGGIFQDRRVDQNSTSTEGGLNVTNKFSLNFARDPSLSSGFSDVQTQAAYGQVNFSFKDAVFLDASLRNEWDSRLPSPYTYQYPSVGVSAIISDLVTLPNKISFLKTSLNYAQVGNGGQFGLLNPSYGYSQGAGNGFLSRSSTLPIPGLKPEIVKNLEFGVEARFLNNRIGFTATYYKSNSTNQLLKVNLPPATGYSDQYINAGNIQNKGFEFVVNGSPIEKRDLTWDVTFNFATNKNKIISLTDDVKLFYLGAGFSRSAAPVVEEGGSYGDLVAYKWATNAKGGLLVNADGKPVIGSTLQKIGNFNPKATIGLTNTLTYKGFSLRILTDGRIGGTVVSGTEMNLAFSGIPAVTEKYREGGWNLGGVDANGQPVTKTITAQDFWQIASGKRYGNGDFFSYDATSFRVRELTLGYAIPLKENKYVKAVKVSFVGRNLFWLYRGKSLLDIPGIGTRKMWFDPDMGLSNNNFQGVEYGNLPATRSVGLNLQVTF